MDKKVNGTWVWCYKNTFPVFWMMLYNEYVPLRQYLKKRIEHFLHGYEQHLQSHVIPRQRHKRITLQWENTYFTGEYILIVSDCYVSLINDIRSKQYIITESTIYWNNLVKKKAVPNIFGWVTPKTKFQET